MRQRLHPFASVHLPVFQLVIVNHLSQQQLGPPGALSSGCVWEPTGLLVSRLCEDPTPRGKGLMEEPLGLSLRSLKPQVEALLQETCSEHRVGGACGSETRELVGFKQEWLPEHQAAAQSILVLETRGRRPRR